MPVPNGPPANFTVLMGFGEMPNEFNPKNETIRKYNYRNKKYLGHKSREKIRPMGAKLQ